ncbi:KH domain-containing protein isoform 1 [Tripterygium wilfordii]|uniref:KH domain-containing protein isoform 1 n=1 Tax=Tripterygium wilfordii TaxID=458696 RepID=A0A7J7BWC0_TRIWF|nr:far upstream element-binding protein 1-like [Tripterygium wilfordii]KAF5726171.1 KH domain-containing protein isoform 1 [Tripterygium wilfordii]
MADEPQYSSGDDIPASNKRKYEDQSTLSSAPRRPTGFSSPIPIHAPPPAYNSVPPPADEIQMAKQKVQEIAARLFNNATAGAAADVKRPRVENGAGAFDSGDRGLSSGFSDGKPLMSNSAPSTIPVSYGGFQGTSKKIDIPSGRVGVVIGKAGDTIKYLQLQSGAKIQVTRDMDADPNSLSRTVDLMGTPEQIAKAEQLINDVLAEADAGGSGIISRRPSGQSGSEHFVMKVPNNKVGLVIGKGGDTIKGMQTRTGARIQVIPLHLPPGDTSTERTLHIEGTNEQIEAAKQLVDEVTSENRARNPSMAGGYSQQGYQARPPTSWGTPGAPSMQQPGYGYVQPGAYPGPSAQYNIPQSHYPGYPPAPTSGGYPSNWDQSTAPPSQQATQGGGYDYYSQPPSSQQQQTPGGSASADNTGYNYNQPPAYGYTQHGQGYPQDGYGGYQAPPQSGYSQAPPQSGYSQVAPYDQQQAYNSAGSHGNVTNPSQEGHTSSYGAQGDSTQAPPPQSSATGPQGYIAGQQPSPNPASYPPKVASQPGYGMPPTSQTGYGNQPPAQTGYGPNYGAPQAQKPANPSVYGQAQQSPSTAGGYGQPGTAQSGYAQPSGYGQPEPGTQRAVGPGYGATVAQPGYGAPPISQQAYGQQGPTSYSTSYGSGSTQPPAYSTDGNANGNNRVSYDAAPASQTVQQSGVAKASPQS